MTKKKTKRATTLAIAATLLGVNRTTLCRWCCSGAPHDKIPCPPMPAGFLFHVNVDELRAWRATKPEGNRKAFINYAAVDGDDV